MTGSRRLLWVKFFLALTIQGCANLLVEAWNAKGQGCPDDDYDNGGSVPRVAGMCKSGTGALVSYKGKL